MVKRTKKKEYFTRMGSASGLEHSLFNLNGLPSPRITQLKKVVTKRRVKYVEY